MNNMFYTAITTIFSAANPLAWAAEKVKTSVASFLYSFLVYIASIIYSFVSYVYQIFLVLANSNELLDDSIIKGFVNRVYVIIGVVVLFLVAYSLLKSMINPDEALKGKKSPVKIIKDVIISVVLIALIPTIFDFAFAFQNSLLRNNTIGKIMLGTSGNNPNETIRKGGYTMAVEVWKAFIIVNDPYCDVGESGNCEILKTEDGTTYNELWKNAYDNTTFWELTQISEFISDGKITYVFLLDILAGAFVLFVLLSYCLEMAVRLVKLAAYELIAPLPILCRIMPNEQANKVFGNWLKAIISTFLEVFIRIAILYFAIMVISTVGTSIDNLFSATTNAGETSLLVKQIAIALIIIGIIKFVKEAPGIIKEITGLDGNKYGKSLIRGIGMMGASLGGGATATIRSFANDKDKPLPNRIGRALSAGASANAKGIWNARKVEKFGDIPKTAGKTSSDILNRRADIEAAGGTGKYFAQWKADKKKDFEGWKTGSFDAKQKVLEEVNSFLKDAKAVKSTTEGLIRDKKYLFNIGLDEKGNQLEYTDSKGQKRVELKGKTSLSEVEAMIQTLKSSGDVEDAKIAAKMESDMNLRIKKIGQAMVGLSQKKYVETDYNNPGNEFKEFDNLYMAINADGTAKQIWNEAAPTLTTTSSQFNIVKQKFDKNSSLDAVAKYKAVTGNSELVTDKVSKLADQLEIQAAEIQQEIKLEQERRKAKDKK